MATAIIEVPGIPTGLASVTCDLFPRGSDTAADSALTLTERTNCKTHYRTTTVAGLSGWHALVVKVDGTALGSWWVLMSDEATVHYATDTDPAAIDNASSGAYAVTITVDDGTTPLESATVRFSKGAETYVGITNVSGIIAFSLDSGTWTVTIVLSGYTFTPTTLAVSATTSQTYSMTQVSVTPPASPSQSTGVLLCVGVDGLPEAGRTITTRLTAGPSAEDGISYDTTEFDLISDVNGYVQYPYFVRGATYQSNREDGTWVRFTVPDLVSFNMPQILGQP